MPPLLLPQAIQAVYFQDRPLLLLAPCPASLTEHSSGRTFHSEKAFSRSNSLTSSNVAATNMIAMASRQLSAREACYARAEHLLRRRAHYFESRQQLLSTILEEEEEDGEEITQIQQQISYHEQHHAKLRHPHQLSKAQAYTCLSMLCQEETKSDQLVEMVRQLSFSPAPMNHLRKGNHCEMKVTWEEDNNPPASSWGHFTF